MRILIGILSCALVVGGTASSVPGYLPAIGPGPIRFHSIAKSCATNAALPALPIVSPPDPVPSVGTNSSAASIAVTPSGTNALDPQAIAAPSTPTPSPGATDRISLTALVPGGSSDPNSTLLVTPQMLVPFFTKPASNGTAAVVVPVGILPPSPNLVPSSSATYFSPPEPGRN